MARIIVEGLHQARAEVTVDDADATGMWDCLGCRDGAVRPNLAEAIQDATVHVDHQCPYRYAD